MRTTGLEPLRFGLGLDRRTGRALTTLASGTIAAFAPGTIGARTTAGATAVAPLTTIGRRTTVAVLAGPSVAAITAIATISSITAVATTSRGEGLGDERLVGPRADDLEALRFDSLVALGWQDGYDGDALDVEVGVGTDHITDLGAVVEQRTVEVAFRLLGSGGTPGPRAIITATRQFNFDPARHRG